MSDKWVVPTSPGTSTILVAFIQSGNYLLVISAAGENKNIKYIYLESIDGRHLIYIKE